MTTIVFADASYWIALLHPRDPLHDTAKQASERLGRVRLLTSEMVLVEVVNGLAKFTALRPAVMAAIQAIYDNPNTEVVPQTTIQFRVALDFHGAHADKEWGLTDCASFLLMRERGITEALTHDHHFEQASFRILLGSSPSP